MIAFLAAVIVCACLYAIGAWLLPRELRVSHWERTSAAFLIGTATVVCSGTALLATGIAFNILAWGTLLAGGLAAREILTRAAEPWERSSLSRPAFALILALALASVLGSVALPINEFDPILHFAYKGKILTEIGTPLDEALTGLVDEQGELRDFGRIVTHPNYPLGVPILEALVGVLGFGWHDRWIQLPLAFWAAMIPALVHFGLRPIGRRAAGAGALVAAATPILYVRNFLEQGSTDWEKAGLGNEFTLGAGADLPVAAMLTGACALFLHGRRTGENRLQLLAGLCLAGAAMMKNEGLALVGCVFLALLLSGALLPFGRGRQAAVGSGLGLAITAGALAPWLWLRGKLPAIDENYTEQFTLERIQHFFAGGLELVEKSPKALVGQADDLLANPPARMDLLPGYFGEEFLDWRSWGLLWGLLVLALPWLPRELRQTDRRWLAMLCLGGVALYFLILLVTPWYLPLLREKGIPERLLLHLIGPICLLIGWRMGGRDASAATQEVETAGTGERSESDPRHG